jgi:hypothetical protein
MPTTRVRRLDSNHDIVMGHGAQDYLSGAASTAQRVQCNLLLILGEYFLDTSAGVPWIQPDSSGIEPILGKMPANRAYAEARIKAAILATDGVDSITAFDLSVDRATRAITVTARGVSVDGDTFEITVGTAKLLA